VHRGQLFSVDDEQDLIETLQELLEAYRPSSDSGRGFRPWLMVRKDVGRKLTAVLMSVLLWSWLQIQLVGEDEIRLDLTLVSSEAEADALRRITPAIYIVVPETFMVRRKKLLDPELNRLRRGGRVKIDVKGLREVISSLELSAVINLADHDLQDSETLIPVPLDQDLFRDKKGNQPDLIEFVVAPAELKIPVEQQMTETFQLTPENVTTVGKPFEGYRFSESRIRIEHNLVTVSGAKSRIEELMIQPRELKLAPVDLDGMITAVSQDVGLDPALAQDVELHTLGGVVTVMVPIEPEPFTVDLLSVPVTYENLSALDGRNLQIVSATETIDLRLTGPRRELYPRTEEWLRQRIRLVYDWNRAALEQAQYKVRVLLDLDAGLANLRVTTLDGRDPQIEYQLEPSVPETGSSP
jgi:hypothetical protein